MPRPCNGREHVFTDWMVLGPVRSLFCKRMDALNGEFIPTEFLTKVDRDRIVSSRTCECGWIDLYVNAKCDPPLNGDSPDEDIGWAYAAMK